MKLSLTAILATLGFSIASPIVNLEARAVTALNPVATAEAHPKDNTATRAVTNSPIKTASGKCLFVDQLSGDFRENLTPIQVGTCDGSQGQNWDVLTSGKHNNVPGSALIVSSLTNACFDFNPSRNDRVSLFSCGGRADGSGRVTNSQLFAFKDSKTPLQFIPNNAKTSCFTIQGNALVIANCQAGNQNQVFTFGNGAAGPGKGVNVATPATTSISSTTTAVNATKTAGTRGSGCQST